MQGLHLLSHALSPLAGFCLKTQHWLGGKVKNQDKNLHKFLTVKSLGIYIEMAFVSA
jgi:hypothetical protein